MRALILILWIFAGSVERSVLQPSQNVSAVVEAWIERSSVHLRQHPAKEEEREESERRTPVSVTAEETIGLHSEIMVEEEDGALSEEVGRPVGERGGSDEDHEHQGNRAGEETDAELREREKDRTGDAELREREEDRTGDAELREREEDRTGDAEGGQGVFNDPDIHASESQIVEHEDLHRSVGQHTTPSSSRHIPFVLSLSSTSVKRPPEILQLHTSPGDQTMPLSGPGASHPSPVTNAATLTNGTGANAAQTESASAKPRPEEKRDATLTAMAARAGPTAASMPSSFRSEPQAGITEAKIKNKEKPKLEKTKSVKKSAGKEKKTQASNKERKVNKLKQEKDTLTLTTAPYFPYFKDDYCPPDCVCYGRVVQCSNKELDKIPYGIPYNSRYILLMNNRIDSIAVGLLSEYLSMEFLVLTNNRLRDSSVQGAFEGVQALRRLYLERNLLQSVPADLPASLEELRLDGNGVMVMTEAAWAHCSGLLILSLNNNSLGNGSSPLPDGVLSPLGSLRTLSLSHNQLTSVPLNLPPSLQELYLRGNLIQRFQGGVFQGEAELQVLDLSANRLTNKGLGKTALVNAPHLESLNLEGNFLKQIPQHLPRSLKTLNLEGNSISAISKTALLSLPHLEHLGLALNKIARISPGAFRTLPLLHQLDLGHNALQQVPRQLPHWLVSITLTHNKIRMVPRDAFCSSGRTKAASSRLVRVQLENNLVDMRSLDSQAFSCLRGPQVVHFY